MLPNENRKQNETTTMKEPYTYFPIAKQYRIHRYNLELKLFISIWLDLVKHAE